MTSPLVHIEQQIARRQELVDRIVMMRNHLAGKSENAVGSGRNYEDVTAQDIERDEAEVASIDAELARLTNGTSPQS